MEEERWWIFAGEYAEDISALRGAIDEFNRRRSTSFFDGIGDGAFSRLVAAFTAGRHHDPSAPSASVTHLRSAATQSGTPSSKPASGSSPP